MINRKTCFTCDNFVGNDYDRLQFVLKNMLAANPILLQQLYYFYFADPRENNFDFSLIDNKMSLFSNIIGEDEEPEAKEIKITPLHLAFFEGNNRSINIILKYMSYLSVDCSYNIKDILPSLIN